MKAIQIQSFEKPSDVVRCVDVADVGAPGANEVVLEVETSPINMSDLLMIAGAYGYRPALPAIVGSEGVGRAVAVGAGVKHLKEGDRTLVPVMTPAWAERIKVSAPWLRPLPPGDARQFAMLGVNPPTAYLLLTDIVKLPRGSWVIQNGANSGVGRATVALAKSLRLKTVNVVRHEERMAEVKTLGGDVVLVDGPELAKRVAAETKNAPIALGLDAVGDTASSRSSKRSPRPWRAAAGCCSHLERKSGQGPGASPARILWIVASTRAETRQSLARAAEAGLASYPGPASACTHGGWRQAGAGAFSLASDQASILYYPPVT